MTPRSEGVLLQTTDGTQISLADDSCILASHSGKIKIPILGSPLIDTLVVPKLHEPLLSVAELCDQGHSVLFTSEGCDVYTGTVEDLGVDVAGSGDRSGNLYYLPAKVRSSPTKCYAASTVTDHSLLGYHRRFNHIGVKPLKRLLHVNGIVPSDNDEIAVSRYITCVQGKMHRLAFKSRKNHRAERPGQMIFSDVGSFETVSREGYEYFITFVDDCSK